MGIFESNHAANGLAVNYQELIQNGAIVVDVRSAAEFQFGHFQGSMNIPLDTLNSKVNELLGKEIILVCRSGGRAGRAKMILQQYGIAAHNACAWQNLL